MCELAAKVEEDENLWHSYSQNLVTDLNGFLVMYESLWKRTAVFNPIDDKSTGKDSGFLA